MPFGTAYEEQVQEIEVVNVGALRRTVSDNVQKDFYLKIRKNADPAQVNGVLFVQEVPEEAKKLYEDGISELDQKKTEQGIAKIEAAIKSFPTYFLALERLGLEYLQLQKFEDSKKIFAEALNINPGCFNCLYGLSYSNYALNQFEVAIEYANKVLEIDRRTVNTLIILGLSYRSTKKYDEAEKILVEAKSLDKNNPDISWNLALLYAHNLLKYDEAASELENYLKNSKDIPDKETIKKLIKQFREKAKQPK